MNLADQAYARQIVLSIDRIQTYCRGERDQFLYEQLVQDAVLRNLHLLAESASLLSEDAKASEPSIQWRTISRFRNVVVHAYLNLDLERVWAVIESDLEPLRQAALRLRDRT